MINIALSSLHLATQVHHQTHVGSADSAFIIDSDLVRDVDLQYASTLYAGCCAAVNMEIGELPAADALDHVYQSGVDNIDWGRAALRTIGLASVRSCKLPKNSRTINAQLRRNGPSLGLIRTIKKQKDKELPMHPDHQFCAKMIWRAHE